MNEIEKKIIKVASGFAIADEELSLDDKIINLGIDSLKIVELIIALEDEFHIQFSDSDLDPTKLVSVADVAALVTTSLGE